MGCNRSRIYHDNEVGIDHKDLALTTFEMQKADIIHDLDTDNDQNGRVAVDCIFRPTREIYGQRAIDMAEELIVWSKYVVVNKHWCKFAKCNAISKIEGEINVASLGIKFRKRPFPHDFPAFAHEKPAVELAQLSRLRPSTERQKTAQNPEFEKMREMGENGTTEDAVVKK
ncbi:hypothetical protein WUBG_01176 [Wuchereria bancrofti]|uniref:Uncharacterized protein n=1 Tax=Wuchereria bancrofti TaxID=6293 RepID=J9F0A3_WUCBA|nr:hypothetical protein WUBG_01176 [Wuchereria bancrofti]VDM08166.1 unnamed protein product [Wuchereria bancrofti]